MKRSTRHVRPLVRALKNKFSYLRTSNEGREHIKEPKSQ